MFLIVMNWMKKIVSSKMLSNKIILLLEMIV